MRGALGGAVVLLLLAGSMAACSPLDPVGEPTIATWELRGSVSPEATEIPIAVMRVECASGKTGRVLAPGVEYEHDRILISAHVETLHPMAANCQGNDAVPAVVQLSEPIGQRALVDAFCENEAVADYAWCFADAGVRWTP